MELDKDFDGYQQWREGTKQTIIGKPGDTEQDAIKFMRAHLEYFGLEERFTFDHSRIERDGDNFIVRIHEFGGLLKDERFMKKPLIGKPLEPVLEH